MKKIEERNIELHRDIIEKLGGCNELSRKVGVSYQAVHAWRTIGIPSYRLVALAPAIEKAGIISRKKLFPESWQFYWPELKRKK